MIFSIFTRLNVQIRDYLLPTRCRMSSIDPTHLRYGIIASCLIWSIDLLSFPIFTIPIDSFQ